MKKCGINPTRLRNQFESAHFFWGATNNRSVTVASRRSKTKPRLIAGTFQGCTSSFPPVVATRNPPFGASGWIPPMLLMVMSHQHQCIYLWWREFVFLTNWFLFVWFVWVFQAWCRVWEVSVRSPCPTNTMETVKIDNQKSRTPRNSSRIQTPNLWNNFHVDKYGLMWEL